MPSVLPVLLNIPPIGNAETPSTLLLHNHTRIILCKGYSSHASTSKAVKLGVDITVLIPSPYCISLKGVTTKLDRRKKERKRLRPANFTR